MQKKVSFSLAFSIIVVLAFAWYSYSVTKYEASLVKEVSRNLSSEDRASYEKILVEADKSLTTKQSKARVDVLMKKAQALQSLGKLAEARDAVKEALKIEKDNESLYYVLFGIQREMKDTYGAKKSIQTSLDLNGKSSNRWEKYLDFAQNDLKWNQKKINGIYEEALKINPKSLDLISMYAKFLEEKGDLEKAKEYWQKLIELDPEKKADYQKEVDRLNQGT
jgi:tetratricopeptide (TPR) repeat protein